MLIKCNTLLPTEYSTTYMTMSFTSAKLNTLNNYTTTVCAVMTEKTQNINFNQ